MLNDPNDERAPTTDPLDGKLGDIPEGATKEQRAVLAYEAAGAMMAALAASADETAAKNYVAMRFEGFAKKIPFDRAEVHFMRPGGMTPVARAEGLAVMLADARAEQRRLRDEQARFIQANVEIAQELADRIHGEGAILGEERFIQALNAIQSANATLRERNRALETQGAIILVALKTARSAIMGDLDHGQALDSIDVALEALGVVL